MANFLVALLLTGNREGFESYLSKLDRIDHPSLEALRQVNVQWQAQRRQQGWLKRLLGDPPPLTLPANFPLGAEEEALVEPYAKLTEFDHTLLPAVVAALNDQDNLSALDAFPGWRETKTQPLE